MNVYLEIWNKFKLQPDIWFFYAFLATFTLSIRKVLFFYPIHGKFNEWTGIYLYLSDIFLILALASWIFTKLYNKSPFLSITYLKLWLYKAYIYLPLFLVLWSLVSVLWSEKQNIALFKAIKLIELYFLYLFIIFRIYPLVRVEAKRFLQSFSSGFCSEKNRENDLFLKKENNTFRKILGFKNNVPRGTFDEVKKEQNCNKKFILQTSQENERRNVFVTIFYIFIFLGFIQSIIGIIQFLTQKSVGLFWLKESLISPDIPGVAKIILNGEIYIRVYGLFPHPNILAGFLLVSITLTWIYIKLFCVSSKENVPRGTNLKTNTGQKPNYRFEKANLGVAFKIYQNCTTFFYGEAILMITKYIMVFSLAIQVVALILTFSKSGIFAFFMIFIYFSRKGMLDLRRTLFLLGKKIGEAKYMTGILKIPTLIVIILFLSLYLSGLNFSENVEKSLSSRLQQFKIDPLLNCSTWNNFFTGKYEITTTHLIGFGHGQYVLKLYNVSRGTLNNWQYQPIHSVFWLILAELGFVGLFVFMLFMLELNRKSSSVEIIRKLNLVRLANVPRETFENNQIDKWTNLQNKLLSCFNKNCWQIKTDTLHLPVSEALKNGLYKAYFTHKLILNNFFLTAFKGIMYGLVLIMLVDHYLWDIQQGQIMLWLIFGFIAGNMRCRD